MSTELKRMTISLMPEWDEDMRNLKKEQFYDKSKSEMLRYLIQIGLKVAKEEQLKHKGA